MYNTVFNKRLGINEHDINDCQDMEQLELWKNEIKKDRANLRVSIDCMELHVTITGNTDEHKYKQLKLIDSKHLYLIELINQCLGKLKQTRQQALEKRFMVEAEQFLSIDEFEKILKLAQSEPITFGN